MGERAYTVSEIDRMRRAVRELRREDTYERQDAAEIEDQLRTYMIAGIAPDDLSDEAERHRQERAGREVRAYQIDIEVAEGMAAEQRIDADSRSWTGR